MILVALAIKDCGNFEEPALDHASQLAVAEDVEKGVPAMDFNKGKVDDFSGEIYNWWTANDQITLTRVGDTLKGVFRNVGPNYTPFGREITSLDFSKLNAFRIRMRAEGKVAPIVRLDVKDNMGRTANSAAPTAKVPVNGGYVDYYYSLKDKWKQGYPDAQIVDPTLVSAVMFFINPGMSGWDGTLYIDEIAAFDAEKIPKKESSAGGVVDLFDDVPSAWWTGSSKVALEKIADKDIVKVISTGAGANYETFGRSFDQTDFTQAPIIRIKARAENEPGQPNPKLRLSIKDKNGFTANEFTIAETIDSGATFKNYFFNFTGKYS